jgi:hypothetical protein
MIISMIVLLLRYLDFKKNMEVKSRGYGKKEGIPITHSGPELHSLLLVVSARVVADTLKMRLGIKLLIICNVLLVSFQFLTFYGNNVKNFELAHSLYLKIVSATFEIEICVYCLK